MQNALTIITPIKPGELNRLNALLLEIGGDIKNNPYIRFNQSTTTHFCRWLLIDEHTDKPQLLFNANFDGSIDAYLRALPGWLGATLDELWGRCVGYPAGRTLNPAIFTEKFIDYLKSHAYPIPVYFRAYFGRSVDEVRQARKLRESFRALLNTDQADSLAGVMRDLPIIPEVRREKRPSLLSQLVNGLLGGLGGVIKSANGGNKLPFDPNTPSKVVKQKLEFTEREIVQNELTILAPLKPGRILFTQLLLPAVGYFSNPPYTSDGKLSDMTTIHFARWVVIDGVGGKGKRMLFESNYDGSWEKYIDDFIDHAWQGLDLIFGNCVGYPKTGARDSEAFKQAILDHQIRAQAFYSAYPDTTVRNIINDLAIYDYTRRILGEKATTDWLRRL